LRLLRQIGKGFKSSPRAIPAAIVDLARRKAKHQYKIPDPWSSEEEKHISPRSREGREESLDLTSSSLSIETSWRLLRKMAKDSNILRDTIPATIANMVRRKAKHQYKIPDPSSCSVLCLSSAPPGYARASSLFVAMPDRYVSSAASHHGRGGVLKPS
jgi:hypothetical protein